MSRIIVNGKFLNQKVTGVQRYAQEIVGQWRKESYNFSILNPPSKFSGLWEQTIYPKKGELVWCPTNTGPLLFSQKVITLHDCAVFYNPAWFSAAYRNWRRMIIPILAERSQLVITVSEFSKSVMTDLVGIKANKIHVIPNGVNTEFFKPLEKDEHLLDRYGLVRPYLLAVGSLDPRKNIKNTLLAWRSLPARLRKEYNLVFVGGSFGSFQKEALEIPDGVIFTGYVSDQDLPYLYSSAKGFVYPSLFEGFGLPVLEAMACGTPVLTSNSTALPEVAGPYARLIDPSDVGAIAEGMVSMLEDEVTAEKIMELIKHAREYSWRLSAKRTWEVLQGVVH
jgi:glycosyltransferase involved in cell wall biosynthesis